MPRPQRIMVFGVLCLVVGALSGLFNLQQVGSAALGPDAVEVPEEPKGGGMMAEVMVDSARANQAALRKPVFRVFSGAEGAIGLVMAGLLVVGGVGLIRDRAWAVRLTTVWACYSIAASVVTVVLQARYVLPEMQTAGPPGSGAAGFVCMLPLLWVFPVLLLTMLNRPIVGDYLRWRQSGGVPRSGLESDQAIGIEPAYAEGHEPPRADPPAEPVAPPPKTHKPADETWRDDPWNDPSSR